MPGSIFTSDLSVNEFLLVREVGFRPVGLVLGTSIYHVGLQIGRWGKNQELDVLSQAMYHARELAMTRMEAEADALHADGIVGVRLDVEMKEFGNDIAEFIAVGTAVKAEEGAGGGGVTQWRNNKNQPFTSDLSGQDFWTLIRAGYAPLGMVMGSCVYHIAHQRMGSMIGNIGRNVEIEQFTQALYDARELAMSRMQAEAEALHAEGIVGVQLRQHSHTWGTPHDRVLRDRHRRPAAAPRSRHRAPDHGAQPGQLSPGAVTRAGLSPAELPALPADGPLTTSSRCASRSRMPRRGCGTRSPAAALTRCWATMNDTGVLPARLYGQRLVRQARPARGRPGSGPGSWRRPGGRR